MAQADYVSNATHELATAASAKPSTDPVRTASALAGKPAWPMPLFADNNDLEDRADRLKKVLAAVSVYVIMTLDDIARNVPGGLTRSIRHAADHLAGRDA